MNIEEIRDYCLAKPGTSEGFFFDETTLVFRVMNKLFALTGLDKHPPYLNLKCDPERAIEHSPRPWGLGASKWPYDKRRWILSGYTSNRPGEPTHPRNDEQRTALPW